MVATAVDKTIQHFSSDTSTLLDFSVILLLGKIMYHLDYDNGGSRYSWLGWDIKILLIWSRIQVGTNGWSIYMSALARQLAGQL